MAGKRKQKAIASVRRTVYLDNSRDAPCEVCRKTIPAEPRTRHARSPLERVDLERLPNEHIARLAQGDNPLEVLGPSLSTKGVPLKPFRSTITDRINHYIGHGYHLLHLGSESTFAGRRLLVTTVAIVGR